VAHEEYGGSLRGISPDFYAPAMMYDEIATDSRVILQARDSHRFFVAGRLEPGATLARARLAVDRVAEQLREDLGWGAETAFLIVPQRDVIVYPPLDPFVRAAAWLLSATVGLVLLITCTNLAGFLLARSLDRRRELAVRLALGAKRRTLIGQALIETTLVSLLGGLAGLAVAGGLLHALTAADLPLPVPVTLDLSIDGSVLVFSLVVSVAAGLVLGLVPAAQGTRVDIATALQDEGAGGGTSSRRRVSLRNGLVGAQVAVCVVLLVGAGLFLRSLQQAQSVDPGFGRDPAALLAVGLSPKRYSEDAGRLVMRRLLDRIEQIPGVRSVGLTHNMLLRKTGRESMAIQVDGVEPPPGRRSHTIDKAYVDAGFFEAVGIPILRGRNFDHGDRPETQQVAIVSAAMAERFWPGQDAVGRRIRQESAQDLVVVGIARDAKVLELGESPRPFIYLPYSQSYAALAQIVARTDVDPERTALQMAAAARELDPELILYTPTTMERHLGFVLLPARLSAWMLSAFAVLAIALASVGLYGIVSYSVSRRTREVGIRLSLGADTRTVTLMLMGSEVRLVAVASAIGLVLAFLASRALSGLLFGIDPLDLPTFVGAPLVLLVVAALAAYLAARRASHIRPADALRAE
jgi:predicted permease